MTKRSGFDESVFSDRSELGDMENVSDIQVSWFVEMTVSYEFLP